MRNASARAIEEAPNHIGKKEWEKPRLQQIPMNAEFETSKGISRAQWEAALELRDGAEQMHRNRQAQARG